MAGVTGKIEDSELQRKIKALRQGVGDPSDLMKLWGEIAHASIRRNFEVGGRPTKWKPLSKVTIALKGHARPLIRRGFLQNITVRPLRDHVLLGVQPAAKDYAARQHFGFDGSGARAGGKVKTPARPFMLLQAEDKQQMGAESRLFFRRLGT